MTFKRIYLHKDLSGITNGILVIVGTAELLSNYKEVIYAARSRDFKIMSENEFNSFQQQINEPK